MWQAYVRSPGGQSKFGPMTIDRLLADILLISDRSASFCKNRIRCLHSKHIISLVLLAQITNFTILFSGNNNNNINSVVMMQPS